MKAVETPRQNHKIVSSEECLEARKAHLAKEKEFTRLRDKLSRQQREPQRVNVDEDYVFDGTKEKETLADLFDGLSELIAYQVMFGPGSEEDSQAARSYPIILTAPWFI